MKQKHFFIQNKQNDLSGTPQVISVHVDLPHLIFTKCYIFLEYNPSDTILLVC